MPRFLNVQFSTVKTRIEMDHIQDLSQLRRSIKQEFSDVIVCSPPFIQLYDDLGHSIHTTSLLRNLPNPYFEEEGLYLSIRIASSSNLNLIDSCV
jgi:hypothetical protein